jgi:putative transposase
VLECIDLHKAHRPQIVPTDLLERFQAEINRRTDLVGIVPNDLAIVRLIGELSIEQNDEWQLQRRNIQLERLEVFARS